MSSFHYEFNESCPLFTTELSAGVYRFELWGANGGGNFGGKGGYSSGILFLKTKRIFYINVGSHGEPPNGHKGGKGGCNGGGDGGRLIYCKPLS